MENQKIDANNPPKGYRLMENLEITPEKGWIDKVLTYSRTKQMWEPMEVDKKYKPYPFLKGVYLPHAILKSFRPNPRFL